MNTRTAPVIIKLPALHGGAWKVAYADFVTAMMAFFLLLWLLNVSTKEELDAIAGFFDPTHPKVSQSQSGAGGVLGGLTMSPKGSMASMTQPMTQQNVTGKPGTKEEAKEKAKERAKELMQKREEQKFEEAKQQLEKAIAEDKELAELAKNLKIDITPEGLRIQIIDQDGQPMFASGSARMFEKTQKLMGKVAEIIKSMPNQLSIRGHTDSVPYGKGADYTNWELSSDRANSTRRVLKDSGIPAERLNDVVGKADTEHLFPETPADPRNRRISIILLKESITNPEFDKDAEKLAEEEGFIEEEMDKLNTADPNAPPQVPIGTFKRTPGSVEFP